MAGRASRFVRDRIVPVENLRGGESLEDSISRNGDRCPVGTKER